MKISTPVLKYKIWGKIFQFKVRYLPCYEINFREKYSKLLNEKMKIRLNVLKRLSFCYIKVLKIHTCFKHLLYSSIS